MTLIRFRNLQPTPGQAFETWSDTGRLLYDPENDGGEGGIRTPGTLSGTPVFKTGAINHSATSPATSRMRKASLGSLHQACANEYCQGTRTQCWGSNLNALEWNSITSSKCDRKYVRLWSPGYAWYSCGTCSRKSSVCNSAAPFSKP